MFRALCWALWELQRFSAPKEFGDKLGDKPEPKNSNETQNGTSPVRDGQTATVGSGQRAAREQLGDGGGTGSGTACAATLRILDFFLQQAQRG